MFFKSSVEYLIVGLGNPGKQYELTRHNIGFRAIDFLAGNFSISVQKLKHYALIGKGQIGSHSVILMKPQTYMNESGLAVADAARYYKIPVENIIIIHDDVSLPVGSMRIRLEGSPGGHNGLKSIENHLSSNQYTRIKLGVGQKTGDIELADYVLGTFSSSDFDSIQSNFPLLSQAVCLLLDGEKQKAMSQFNINVKKDNLND